MPIYSTPWAAWSYRVEGYIWTVRGLGNQLSSLRLRVGARMYPAFHSDLDFTGPALRPRLGAGNPQRLLDRQ